MNQILTIGMVTKRQMFVLKNSCEMLPLVTPDFQKEFAVPGAKVGQVIKVRKPPMYEVREGAQIKLQDTKEEYVDLALDIQIGIDTPFTMKERTLDINDYSRLVAEPKMAKLANHIDRHILRLGEKFGNSVGTPGTTPTAMSTYSEAGALLADLAEPQDAQRYVVMTPDMHSVASSNNLGLFNPANAITEAYRTGLITKYAGRKYYMDQNCPTHTFGAQGGTPLVNNGGQSGSSLVTDGWTSAAATRLRPGDIFTIQDVYSVNPESKDSTTKLQQFCVMAPGVSDSSGNMTILIDPPIVPSGPFQNVSASPANNAPLTLLGVANESHRYGLAFHKGAILTAFIDIELPPNGKGVIESYRVRDDQTGLSVATVTSYDINFGQTITRTDIFGGAAIAYSQLGCRIWQR